MNADDSADMVEKEPYHTNLNRSTIAYFIRQQQAEIEALTTQFVRVADQNNRLKDQVEMLKKGKVEYGYDTTKTS